MQHHQANRLTEAQTLYRRILGGQPGHPVATHMLGLVALARQEFGEAARLFLQALESNPGNGDAASNLGVAFRGLGRKDDALRAFRRALDIDPDDQTARFNLGLTLSDLGRLEEAQQAYQDVLSRTPDHIEALNNLGNVLWDQGFLDDAAGCYEKALAKAPDNAEIHKTLGFLQLLRGDFERGWRNYAWRLKEAGNPLKVENYAGPSWQREDLSGKTLLVYHEQGLGDVIQFVRYLPLLRERGARVVFEVQAPLLEIMAASDLADLVVETGRELPGYDFHIPLLELPRLFATRLESIPGEVPYLKVPEDRLAVWRQRFDADGGFKVGLVWMGNPVVASNPKRSIDPALLTSLSEIPGVSLYSLQVGRDGEARAVFGDRVTDHSPLLKDYADTAAAMTHLDLVISTCTSPLHMAGALSVPTWGLLCKWPDWRWLIGREDSPWYPGMKLFRQKTAGDWEPVVGDVMALLTKLSRQHS